MQFGSPKCAYGPGFVKQSPLRWQWALRVNASSLFGGFGLRFAEVPLVNHELEVLQIAFVVVAQLAHRGLEGASMDGSSHLGGVFGLGGGDAISNDLNGGVGRVDERAARVFFLDRKSVV